MNQKKAEQKQIGGLLWRGAVGGVISGIIFAMSEMVLNVLMGKPFFGPLRLIGSILLGQEALKPTYPLVTAAIPGLVIHMIMSMMFGLVFVTLLAIGQQRQASIGRLLIFGTLFGLALWVVNFQILGRLFFPQFTMVNQFWNGFFAHTFFFGSVIGTLEAILAPRLVVLTAPKTGNSAVHSHS